MHLCSYACADAYRSERSTDFPTHEVFLLTLQDQQPRFMQVDDVLERYGLQLTGPSAVHAVAIDHSGFDLFPLDEENLEANAGSVVTAAAFVPVGLVSDQSDSESQDSTCGEVGQ